MQAIPKGTRRELRVCYASLALVTAWTRATEVRRGHEEVLALFMANLERLEVILVDPRRPPSPDGCTCSPGPTVSIDGPTLKFCCTGSAGFSVGNIRVAHRPRGRGRDRGRSVRPLVRPAAGCTTRVRTQRVRTLLRSSMSSVTMPPLVGAGFTVADLPLYASNNDPHPALLAACTPSHALVLASSMVATEKGTTPALSRSGHPAPDVAALRSEGSTTSATLRRGSAGRSFRVGRSLSRSSMGRAKSLRSTTRRLIARDRPRWRRAITTLRAGHATEPPYSVVAAIF